MKTYLEPESFSGRQGWVQHLFADLLVAKIRKQESYCGKGPEFMIETENKLVSLEATLVQNTAQQLTDGGEVWSY